MMSIAVLQIGKNLIKPQFVYTEVIIYKYRNKIQKLNNLFYKTINTIKRNV